MSRCSPTKYIPAVRLLTVQEVDLNNNPPAGDLKDDFGCSPTVDPHIGAPSGFPLLVPVVFPPILEIPILESQPQFFAAAQAELVVDML
jgi:hypothetical protein